MTTKLTYYKYLTKVIISSMKDYIEHMFMPANNFYYI